MVGYDVKANRFALSLEWRPEVDNEVKTVRLFWNEKLAHPVSVVEGVASYLYLA